jgi:hypothetical protein
MFTVESMAVAALHGKFRRTQENSSPEDTPQPSTMTSVETLAETTAMALFVKMLMICFTCESKGEMVFQGSDSQNKTLTMTHRTDRDRLL